MLCARYANRWKSISIPKGDPNWLNLSADAWENVRLPTIHLAITPMEWLSVRPRFQLAGKIDSCDFPMKIPTLWLITSIPLISIVRSSFLHTL